jgi:hypothetical protein
MDVGESVAVAMEAALRCPMEHAEPVKITSQPAIKVKDVEVLKSNMEKGKSTILFGLDGTGKVVDKGLQQLCDPCPSPADEIRAKDPLPIKLGNQQLPLSMAAHHIIPGEDALPKSDIKKYVWKSEKVIFSDIGYHVDGSENGVWLPTHQALSAGMGKAATIKVPSGDDPTKLAHYYYAELSNWGPNEPGTSFIFAYTQMAMNLTNGQFHDTHKEYSKKIIEMLNGLHTWISEASGDNCNDCKTSKSPDGKLPPPHMLVFRLNALARQVRGWLVGPPENWRAPYFTSDYAQQYKEVEEQYIAHMTSRGYSR